ncbi:hypothetical protein [Pacificibacter sp. AS14]|uniref:hypothetical protein n=1 Tax=Pacificibacter sp. AS14 TaxID=3135785 RepID=UPI0031755795
METPKYPPPFSLRLTFEERARLNKAAAGMSLVKAAFRTCWDTSDSASALQTALEERGYFLARGDRRGFVAVDSVSNWRRMARAGKFVLPNLDGMEFMLVQIGEPKALNPVCPSSPSSGTLDVMKGDITIRLAGDTPTVRIAEIVASL